MEVIIRLSDCVQAHVLLDPYLTNHIPLVILIMRQYQRLVIVVEMIFATLVHIQFRIRFYHF